jgi:two-component SAPR family response regulator
VSNGIDQNLTASFLFYTLFFSPRQQKIYALFCRNHKEGTSDISFYEMNFPPLSQSEIAQKTSVGKKSFSWIAVAETALASLLVIVFLLAVSKRRKKPVPAAKKAAHIAKPEKNIAENQTGLDKIITETNDKIYDRNRQCISLLGGFNVMDKAGNNISPNFTPILKNLLLLILLYSEIGGKGINDKKIDGLLWADKDDKAARNNRNVSLTRLKLLLENIGDISLLNSSGFWKISIGQNVFCDYQAALLHIRKFKTNDMGKGNLSELLELLMYGQLLPYTQADWLDKFKSDYSNDAIDILYNLLQGSAIKDEKLKLQIADTIFLFDSLNEEALGIKCSILYNSGKKGLAKNAYDIFSKEYKAMLGEDYPYSLPQVLESACG